MRIFLICCCFFINTINASDCQFIIHSQAEIPPGPISFEYIGELQCESEETRSKIESLLNKTNIGTIYPYSPPFTLKKSYLTDKWQQFNREFTLQFDGAEVIQIRPTKRNMDIDALKTLAYKEILSTLEKNHNYEITFHNFPQDVTLPAGEYDIVFDAKRAHQGHLRLRISSGGRLQKQYFIRFSLREKRFVLKTITTIPARTNINPDMVEVCEEFTDLHQKPLDVQLIHETADLFSKRIIGKGAVLTHENISFTEIIKNRQSINGILTNGGININIPLTALQSGRRGDRILLEDPRNRKRYYGRIIDAGNARIEF